MADSDKELGMVIEGLENCKGGIDDLKTMFRDHTEQSRETDKDLYHKVDKAHQRIDDVKQEYAKDKGKALGVLAAISAFFTWLMKTFF